MNPHRLYHAAVCFTLVTALLNIRWVKAHLPFTASDALGAALTISVAKEMVDQMQHAPTHESLAHSGGDILTGMAGATLAVGFHFAFGGPSRVPPPIPSPKDTSR